MISKTVTITGLLIFKSLSLFLSFYEFNMLKWDLSLSFSLSLSLSLSFSLSLSLSLSLVNDGRNRQTIETVCERLPQFDVVSSLAFVIEAVDTVDGGTLMVSPENEEVLRIFNLVSEEEADGLEAVFAPVHVVPQEQVIRFRWESPVFEQSEQVIVLSVNVSTNFDGSLQLEKDGLGDEDFSGLHTQSTDFGLGQHDGTARSGTPHFE